MSKGKENSGGAQTSILKYLELQNRPYSVIDIVNNLHKEFGKTLVTKTLDTLVEQGSVKEKVYGKQKVYVYNQDNVPTADKQELAAMDREIETVNRENEQLQSEINTLTSKHKQLNSTMTLAEAKEKLKLTNTEITSMTEKLTQLRGGQVLITKEEKDKVHSKRTEKVKQWRKRKRLATDMLDAILEGYPKPKKTLMEEIGIETDEDYKVTPPKD